MLTIRHEAVPEQSEDSEPLAVENPDGSFVLGVFDGLGGSGSARYDVDGVERKGAYIASRLARRATEATARAMLQFSDQRDGAEADSAGTAFAARLEERLRQDFAEAADSLGGEPTKLRSPLVRVLPTTAAIAMVGPPKRRGSKQRRAAAIWAGDSRIYILTPHGLEQISRDDTRADADAFISLSTDPPIDNCISASEPFELRRVEWELDSPCLVIAASDGCFGYLPTPAHFELVLLEAMTSSRSLQKCQGHLKQRITAVARDDATLAAAVLDGGDFRSLQQALDKRRVYVDQAFVDPYEWQQREVRAAEEAAEAANAHRDKQVEARDKYATELWDQYRHRYERLLAPLAGAKERKHARKDRAR